MLGPDSPPVASAPWHRAQRVSYSRRPGSDWAEASVSPARPRIAIRSVVMEDLLPQGFQFGLDARGHRVTVHVQHHRNELVVTHHAQHVHHTAFTELFLGSREGG